MQNAKRVDWATENKQTSKYVLDCGQFRVKDFLIICIFYGVRCILYAYTLSAMKCIPYFRLPKQPMGSGLWEPLQLLGTLWWR